MENNEVFGLARKFHGVGIAEVGQILESTGSSHSLDRVFLPL